ncbi:MAG: hypothetical protein HQ482_04830 [Sphingomonadales bacterium]|nr:hypothetical protein [Sphingomonadales bacterium]
METENVRKLLSQYPPSFAKDQAHRLIRNALHRPDPERPLKFIVYDILYAFQMLEARRLGLGRDRDPVQYAKFRRNYINAVAMWVPGKDPFIDGIRMAATSAARHNDPELDKILKDLAEAETNRTSMEQSRKALSPRKMGPFNRYVWKLLEASPELSEGALQRTIESDYQRGNSIFSHISLDEIEIDIKETEECETILRSGIRSRLSRLKNKKAQD